MGRGWVSLLGPALCVEARCGGVPQPARRGRGAAGAAGAGALPRRAGWGWVWGADERAHGKRCVLLLLLLRTHPTRCATPPAARRGSAAAAGLLLASHEAGSQGNALLAYTWDTNALVSSHAGGGGRRTAAAAGAHSSGGSAVSRRAPTGGRQQVSHVRRSARPSPTLVHPQEVTFGVPSPASAAPEAANQLHLPAPPSASSPRKQARGAAAAAGQPSPPGSPAAAAVQADAAAAVDVQLAALAEPLPQAPAVQEAAGEAASPRAAPARRLGGPLAAPAADAEGRVRLRVLLDGSALEAFTGSGEVRRCGAAGGGGTDVVLADASGPCLSAQQSHAAGLSGGQRSAVIHLLHQHNCQVLSTRVYRGSPPAGATAAGLTIVALGGTAVLESGAAWEMDGCWAAGEGEAAAG